MQMPIDMMERYPVPSFIVRSYPTFQSIANMSNNNCDIGKMDCFHQAISGLSIVIIIRRRLLRRQSKDMSQMRQKSPTTMHSTNHCPSIKTFYKYYPHHWHVGWRVLMIGNNKMNVPKQKLQFSTLAGCCSIVCFLFTI